MSRRRHHLVAVEGVSAEFHQWWRDLRLFSIPVVDAPLPESHPFSRLHRWIEKVDGPGWPPPPPTAGEVARAQQLVAELGLAQDFERFRRYLNRLRERQ